MQLSEQLQEKIDRSIERIKAFEPPEGYYMAFSGGKDSVVIKALCDMAGVKYDAHYGVTTVDPPELVRFIRDQHPDVLFDKPQLSMRQLIIKYMVPPTRQWRYCCKYLKEVGGRGRVVMTGTRWDESNERKNNHGLVTILRRKTASNIADKVGADYQLTKRGGIIMNMDNDMSRRTVEQCYRTSKTLVNPIVDWADNDVWEFIRSYNIPYCSLYDEGWTRLGCIGCPIGMSKQRKRELDRWPGMKRMYINAFNEMLEARRAIGKHCEWQTGEDVLEWWVQSPLDNKPLEDQIEMGDM